MSGKSIEFSTEETTAPWQYRLTLWFIRQILDVADAMAYWTDKLEEWAKNRWGGYSNQRIGHDGRPWCEDLAPHYQDYQNRIGDVQPGDIVTFNWNDDTNSPDTTTFFTLGDDKLNVVRRLKSCVDNWPECHSGGYDPRCCRFPKSCSASIFDPTGYKDEDLV
jgi:hypothetical protein